MQCQAIHEKAVHLSKQYRKCENDLLSALMEADRAKIYEHFALTSTYAYCVQVLQLSEDQSLTLIRVARKAFPRFQTAPKTHPLHSILN